MSALDNLIEKLKRSSSDGVFVLNKQRVEQMDFAYHAISRALKEAGCNVKVDCRQSELVPSLGIIDVEGVSIKLASGTWFSRAAEFASSVEVYPLAKSGVRLTLGFNDLTTRVS